MSSPRQFHRPTAAFAADDPSNFRLKQVHPTSSNSVDFDLRSTNCPNSISGATFTSNPTDRCFFDQRCSTPAFPCVGSLRHGHLPLRIRSFLSVRLPPGGPSARIVGSHTKRQSRRSDHTESRRREGAVATGKRVSADRRCTW